MMKLVSAAKKQPHVAVKFTRCIKRAIRRSDLHEAWMMAPFFPRQRPAGTFGRAQ
jgi:hypothetical protein